MLTVVFGAGASYDSIPSRPPGRHEEPQTRWYRPPLANELFGDREIFADAISRFDRLQPVIPRLRHTAGKNVETALRKLQDEATDYPERKKQLMAVRYYLHHSLWDCEAQWRTLAKGVTNYKTLLDDIARWRQPNEEVCLVTFNYDTLLEDALPSIGLTIKELSDYVFGSVWYKVFKLHRSVNWARVLRTHPHYQRNDHWAVARANIERADQVEATDKFVRVDEHPCGILPGGLGLIPAIAIPVEQKSYFECPSDHLRELERLLPHTERMLLIGWRATEQHFLNLPQKHVTDLRSGLVVAGSESEAQEIADRVSGALSNARIRWETAPAGFTDFILNRRADDVLRDGR
jgi:hypothetical protein